LLLILRWLAGLDFLWLYDFVIGFYFAIHSNWALVDHCESGLDANFLLVLGQRVVREDYANFLMVLGRGVVTEQFIEAFYLKTRSGDV
jgi:hypothetical protein